MSATVQSVDSLGMRWLMVVLAVITVISLLMVFRPRPQSPFSEAGGYGRGYGSESLMFGADSRAGAPHLP